MQEPSEPSERLREGNCAAYRQGEVAAIAFVDNLLKP